MLIPEPTSTAFAFGLLSRRGIGHSVASSIYVSTTNRRSTSVRWFTSLDVGSNGKTFETSFHAPVMWYECVSALLESKRFKYRDSSPDKQDPAIFVDCTLGGGGHTSALLDRLSAGDIVVGCDMDPVAISTASERLSNYLGSQHDTLPLFVPVRSNFCDLASLLPKVLDPITNRPILGSDGLVDGILLDLGVSSHQIDTADRGFAFMKNGPLDMRMSSDASFSAADVCNEFDVQELAAVFKKYGDEPRCRAIAQSIARHRPLQTTTDLVNAVAAVIPEYSKTSRRQGRIATLARVFQSIRILVNEEDKALEKALLHMSPTLLRPGGRLAVLSYHSIEDRATKRVMRSGTLSAVSSTKKDLYGNVIGPPRPFQPIGKRINASDDEISRNPRARSATLRVAERLEG